MSRYDEELFAEPLGKTTDELRKMPDRFVDKTTTVKTLERIKFKAIPFSKGYKIQIEWAFNPDNTYHVDQMLSWETSEVKQTLEAFKKNVIEVELGGKLITDQ